MNSVAVDYLVHSEKIADEQVPKIAEGIATSKGTRSVVMSVCVVFVLLHYSAMV